MVMSVCTICTVFSGEILSVEQQPICSRLEMAVNSIAETHRPPFDGSVTTLSHQVLHGSSALLLFVTYLVEVSRPLTAVSDVSDLRSIVQSQTNAAQFPRSTHFAAFRKEGATDNTQSTANCAQTAPKPLVAQHRPTQHVTVHPILPSGVALQY